MEKIDDWILRYGFLMGKRYTDGQRVKFLRSMTREFAEMAYPCETTSFSLAFMGTQKKFYNLYAGDLKKAKVVIATYYDTPTKSFGLYKERAFQTYASRFAAAINLIPALIIFCLASFLIFFGLFPLMDNNNFIVVLSIIVALVAIFFIVRYRSGIPRRLNMVRNTSSLLAILELASRLKAENSEFAFALVDGGCNSNYGFKVAKDYFKKGKKKFIILDSIGNDGDLIRFANQAQEDEIETHDISSSWQEIGDILLTAGKYDSGEIILKKNKEVKKERIEETVNYLMKVINQDK